MSRSKGLAISLPLVMLFGWTTYAIGKSKGKEEGITTERSAMESEIKAYLDLPQDVRMHDLNRDTRFQIEEVAELRKANLIHPSAFLMYDKSGYHVSAIEISNVTSAYHQEKERMKNK